MFEKHEKKFTPNPTHFGSPHTRSPPKLHQPKKKKRKKEIFATQLMQAHNELVDQYR